MTAAATVPMPLLYRCTPYSAWIPKRQCETNRARLRASKKEKGAYGTNPSQAALDAIGLSACGDCHGVEALAARGGMKPRAAGALQKAAESLPHPAGPPVSVRRPAPRRNYRVGASGIDAREAREEGKVKVEKCKAGLHELKGWNRTKAGDCRSCAMAAGRAKGKRGAHSTAVAALNAGAAATPEAEGRITLHIDVSISTAELSGWSPDRIAAFFAGIGQLVRAKDAAA